MTFELIQSIINNDEAKVESVLTDLLGSKLHEAINSRRVELAKQIFEKKSQTSGEIDTSSIIDTDAEDNRDDVASMKKKKKGSDCSDDDYDDSDDVKESANLDEAKKADRFHIVTKDGKPANLTSYATLSAAQADRKEKHPGTVIHQVGPRGSVKHVFEEAELDEAMKPLPRRHFFNSFGVEGHGIAHDGKGNHWKFENNKPVAYTKDTEVVASWKRDIAAKSSVSEEAEEIEEISRNLVTNYIRAAKPNSEFADTGVPAKGKDRTKGVRLAFKKKFGDKKFGFPEPKVKATD